MPTLHLAAIEVYTLASRRQLQGHYQAAMEFWQATARDIPRCMEEPFHSVLVQHMDAELDLRDWDRNRFSVPL